MKANMKIDLVKPFIKACGFLKSPSKGTIINFLHEREAILEKKIKARCGKCKMNEAKEVEHEI